MGFGCYASENEGCVPVMACLMDRPGEELPGWSSSVRAEAWKPLDARATRWAICRPRAPMDGHTWYCDMAATLWGAGACLPSTFWMAVAVALARQGYHSPVRALPHPRCRTKVVCLCTPPIAVRPRQRRVACLPSSQHCQHAPSPCHNHHNLPR